ncbi:Hpt domain-containing protein [Magnetovirga frankeli]|uniref:Hpt domain-containing protein n=1 Tax=Magnetovirga frankeli TaxID=947516 RepID=UPI001AF8CBB9|nr:Hpt domain-containing protein [gamma proteobacterium SS-5]
MQAYLQEAERLLGEIEQHLAADQHELLRRAAHGLKSCSGSLGAARMFHLAQTLEQAAAQGLASVEHLLHLQKALEHTRELLQDAC